MPIRRSGVGYADFSGGDANHIIGCTPVSAGCANCYARALIEGRQGRDFSEIRLYPDKLKRLATIRFRENAVSFRRGSGSRPLIFPVDLGDHFHPDVPTQYIYDTLDTYALRDDADWLLLTKRADRMATVVTDWLSINHLARLPYHIWPGVTVENNATLQRAEHLLKIPAITHWLSIEPMLEWMDLESCLHWEWYPGPMVDPKRGTIGGKPLPAARLRPNLAWIVLGAESGPNRRSFDLDWARATRDGCAAAGVPFFYKQGSHRFPGRNDVLDGLKHKQFPLT